MDRVDIVLLRGLAREAGHWGFFVESLESQEFIENAFALDLPGAGRFHKITSPLTVGEMAEFVMAEIDQLPRNKKTPLVLLTVSLGSMVGIELAARYPQNFHKVILINVSVASLSPVHHRLLISAWKSMIKILSQKSEEQREKEVLQMVSNNPEARQEALPLWVKIAKEHPLKLSNVLRQLVAAATYSLPKSKPNCPMVIFSSEQDRMVSPKCPKRLAHHWQLPLHSHPSAGHELALDDPQWLIAKLTEILSV